jgi:hypothetical protein
MLIMDSLWLLGHCAFEKTPTSATLFFQAVVFVAVGLGLWFLNKIQTQILARFGIMALGVLIFELFTAPMWRNTHLGPWAYLYYDVSWILTIGWSILFLGVVEIVDKLLPSWREWKRFLLYLGVLIGLTLPLEIWVVNIDIRSYAPEVLESLSGFTLANVPIELTYYVPVFAGLVIGFYKYWGFVLEDKLLIPLKKIRWARGIAMTALAIFMFEVMVEPMVVNAGFPSWSFIFHDISIIMTGIWVGVIAVTALLVYRFFPHYPIATRFVIALSICTAVALPVEYYLFVNGIRVYGPSAIANFSGFTIPVINAPIEIAFAIPCYMALVIGLVRYWEIALDNRL